jgi:hypothetical protein
MLLLLDELMMDQPFQIGDVVECIESHSEPDRYYELGNFYRVRAIFQGVSIKNKPLKNVWFIRIEDSDRFIPASHPAERFVFSRKSLA